MPFWTGRRALSGILLAVVLIALGWAAVVVSVAIQAAHDEATGAHDTLNEADVGREYLVRLGIPENVVLPLVGGHDTFTSIEQVKRWFDGRDSRRVLLVSDGFHMLRLQIIARRLGLTPYTSPATGSPIHANVRRNAGYLLAEGFKVPFTWLFQR